MYGYHDRLAWIDLTNRRVEIRPIGEKDAEAFVGGSGLGSALLARLTGAETDPLGPDNPMIFMTGPFTASGVPSTSRHEAVSLSPLTGILGESNSGGSLAWELKRSGFDGLVLTGASQEPVTVVIKGQEITLRDSQDLWGLDVYAADDILKDELGSKAVTAMIGPAGENLARIASISHNGRHTRSLGRCGLGAVMGSKKLKAIFIAAGGREEAPVSDPAGLKASIKEAIKRVRERLDLFGQMGTPGGVVNYERMGNLPINNWRQARHPELAQKTTGTTLKETIWAGRTGCKSCPVQCGRLVDVKEGPFAMDGPAEGPEYETLAAFGSLCLNDNLEAIAKANDLCNRLGLDTISTGSAVAFAMECREKGLLSQADLDGLDLAFGHTEAMVEMVRRIGLRQGEMGRLLGEGTRVASRTIGQGAEEYAVHCKGLEFPMHDPRFSWGHALSYPTGARGACHLTSLSHPFEMGVALPELGYDEPFPGRERPGKAEWTMHLQNLMTLLDSLVICKFSMLNNALTVTHFQEWYGLITGHDLDTGQFMALGERAFNLKRLINNRRGITRKDDVLPPRMRTLKKQGEGFDFDVPPLPGLLSDYYGVRGWTEEGRPGAETIARLGLKGWAE